MSYDKQKKNRIEERVYSVTMTEEELSLFSEFLEQKEFEDKFDRYSDPSFDHGYHYPHKPVEKMTEDEYDAWLKYSDKYIPDYAFEPKQHRLSKEAYDSRKDIAKGLEKDTLNIPKTREKIAWRENEIKRLEEENKRVRRKDREINDFLISTHKHQVNHHKSYLENQLLNLNEDTLRLMDKEDDLAETGYDDKYSSKVVEKITKRGRGRGSEEFIRPGRKAEKIIDKRLDLAKKYKDHDSKNPIDSSKFSGKTKEFFRDAGRKWDDASMVYDVSTDGRSLGKDVAIAAGVTSALGAGAYALGRHLKKKKAEKEIAKDKFKTSSDNKKKEG